MPKTRNDGIDAYFNSDGWTLSNDITLMHVLSVAAASYRTLSSMQIFNEVINQVHFDLDRLLPKKVTLLDVKARIRALRSRFYDFKEYIIEPGVHFDPNNLRVSIDPAQYTAEHAGASHMTYQENITRRWFRNHGFPMYDYCVEVFENKQAALIDFTGYAGYAQTEPVVVDDLEEEDEETNVIGDACDEEGVVHQPTLFRFETGGSSKGHNV